ncbi:hypothetical protein PV327_002550 [Microctonus hyperodae]|uniref:UAS domain-containing protein n=1 Tax=Microctonus hyperodae TaxID=165561 RepID=A0AA39FFT6_MICHY|nr:hypothetical protein PV327_002550 [Microctonus hyperodae]
MDRELIEKFIEVTGESEATAIQYLTLAEGNVENAISLMFEGHAPIAERDNVEPDEPPVRAPILPTQEVLVPSEPACSFPRASSNVFDRFRDFSVEIRRQEEEMTMRVSGNKKLSRCKTKRLEDLFRPPYDILLLGTFIEARERAKSINRWLLVNIQNPQEFSCQILNRDVWPDKQIKEIVKDHFILWQVLSDTADGRGYINFYNVTTYPYLAIVDPRTGECMRSYTNITVDSLLTGLNDMLSTHPSPDSTSDFPCIEESHCEPSSSMKRPARFNPMSKDSGRRIKKSRPTSEATTSSIGSSYHKDEGSVVSTSTGNHSIIRGKRSRIEVPDNLDDIGPSESAIVPSKDDSSASNACNSQEVEPSKSEISNGDGPSLRLCLRLPSGGREAVLMCANDTIETFIRRVEEMGYARSEHTYLIPFPKTNVGALPSQTRLFDTILYPSNTVFITKV